MRKPCRAYVETRGMVQCNEDENAMLSCPQGQLWPAVLVKAEIAA